MNLQETLRKTGFVLDDDGIMGTPFTYDEDGGVVVVYDDLRRPWVAPSHLLKGSQLEELARGYNLKSGAYVPYTTDGGVWMQSRFSSGV